jgi:hypothetical protein
LLFQAAAAHIGSDPTSQDILNGLYALSANDTLGGASPGTTFSRANRPFPRAASSWPRFRAASSRRRGATPRSVRLPDTDRPHEELEKTMKVSLTRRLPQTCWIHPSRCLSTSGPPGAARAK